MLNLVRRCCVIVCVLIFLVACSRSHIPLQFEGAAAYNGGNVELDSAIETFKNTHSFQHVTVWTVDLSHANTFRTDQQANVLESTDRFQVDAMEQTLLNQISSFYVVTLNNADYHSAFVDSDTSTNMIAIKAVNKQGVTERVVHIQHIGAEFLIIDAY